MTASRKCRRVPVAALASLLVAWGVWPAMGQEPAAKATDAAAEAAELVVQLGAPSFTARERATKRLTRLGIVARAALEAASKDSDAEVRSRAGEILADVLEADFQTRLEAFAADIDSRQKYDLPSWDRFRKQLGDDRSARLLFVEMQRAEPALLEIFATGGKPAGELFTNRCLALQQSTQLATNQNDAGQGQISLGTVAALLFVGGAEDVPVDEQAGVQLFSFIQQPVFQASIQQPGMPSTSADPVQSARLKKLLGAWIVKNNGSSIAFQNLMLAFHFELKEGLDLGVRMLGNDSGQPHVRQYAILAIGRFGDKRHIPLIEPLLKDATPCLSQRINGHDVQTQIRDFALAVLVSLTSQQFKDYGFEHLQLNQQLLVQPNTVGFADRAKREAALAKWADWSMKQSK
jgi:hypothetical protein